MEEVLISLETAKLAKEKGFDEQTIFYYHSFGLLTNPLDQIDPESVSAISWNKTDDCYSAPTQSLLQKWLRDVHLLHVDVEIGNSGIYVNIFSLKGSVKMIKTYGPEGGYSSYEEALKIGLKETLNLI